MAQAIRHGQTISSVPFGYDRSGRRLRTYRRIKDDRLRHCWTYPLTDGAGVALLFFFPPFLGVMALPIMDLIVHFKPTNALNPVNLLIIPFTMPLVICFTFFTGYLLIFFGRMMLDSANGEELHPRFPVWNRLEIVEELGRWIWALTMGLIVGGAPAILFWVHCGDLDALDWFLFLDLLILGVSYGQMALMAALFHETLIAANPVTVIRSIARIGWNYLTPSLVSSLMLVATLGTWYAVLNHAPSISWGVVGLWACWVETLYLMMVLCRMLGFLYARYAAALEWFKTGRASRL